MPTKHSFIRLRLSIMMFLTFFLWASWYVPLGGYANSILNFTSPQIGWLYATTAIAAMVSPIFVGLVADMLFSTERVLACLHLFGAVSLFMAARQTEFSGLMTCLIINALLFMPTLALANSLAFRNIDDRDKFSRVAVWGTIGWIISGLCVSFLLNERSEQIFYLAAGGGVAMAIFSLLGLPHTPPKGRSGGDLLGLGALKLLGERSFLVFTICAFLISIPLSFYFTWGNAFLNETDRPNPTALMTLCQFSEIFVAIVMPVFIGKIGLKNVLVLGMAAWAVRYLCFASMSFPLIIVGLLVHGFCYCFVFMASFIYADKKAPEGMSASAQSFISFVIWGLGMFVGTQLAGWTADQYPPPGAIHVTRDGELLAQQALPNWTIKIPKADAPEATEDYPRLSRALKSPEDDRIAISLVDDLPEEGVTFTTTQRDGTKIAETYAKADLAAALKAADTDGDGTVTYAEWRTAQAKEWPPIWLWPAALAAAVCVLFFMGGEREKTQVAETQDAAA